MSAGPSYTEVLINQMKQEDAEITSLRSAARLMRSKTKIPAEYQTLDARSDINQRNNRLGRNNVLLSEKNER